MSVLGRECLSFPGCPVTVAPLVHLCFNSACWVATEWALDPDEMFCRPWPVFQFLSFAASANFMSLLWLCLLLLHCGWPELCYQHWQPMPFSLPLLPSSAPKPQAYCVQTPGLYDCSGLHRHRALEASVLASMRMKGVRKQGFVPKSTGLISGPTESIDHEFWVSSPLIFNWYDHDSTNVYKLIYTQYFLKCLVNTHFIFVL